jgi:hypothetical protein
MPVIDTNKTFLESLYPGVLGYLRESKNHTTSIIFPINGFDGIMGFKYTIYGM